MRMRKKPARLWPNFCWARRTEFHRPNKRTEMIHLVFQSQGSAEMSPQLLEVQAKSYPSAGPVSTARLSAKAPTK